MTIPLVRLSPDASSRQPDPSRLKQPSGGFGLRRPARAGVLFGVAPGGACRAIPVARDAVGSYPTVSPLPALGPAV